MAVELFAFPSAAAAPIQKGRYEELVSMNEFVRGIECDRSSFLGFDLLSNGGDFQRELDRVLKTLLLQVSRSGGRSTPTFLDVVVSGGRNQLRREYAVPTVPTEEFPDGGHRCPYFPCPTCHRSRTLFPGTESSDSSKAKYPNSACNSDDLIASESREEMSSNWRECQPLITCPDSGHKCQGFPCDICHKDDRNGESKHLTSVGQSNTWT